jgi:hypothetical protein
MNNGYLKEVDFAYLADPPAFSLKNWNWTKRRKLSERGEITKFFVLWKR